MAMTMRNALTVVSLAALLAACGGGGGGDSAPGVDPGPPPPGGQVTPPPPVLPKDTVSADAIVGSDLVEAEISSVAFDSPLSVTFNVVVNGSQRVTDLSGSNARFTLAKLVPRDLDDTEDWVSYIVTSEDPVCRSQSDIDSDNNACTTFTTATDPDQIPDSALKVQDPVATGRVPRDQATYERDGEFRDNGDGSWTYVFTTDPGDPATLGEMHRVCIQFGFAAETDNECIDFIPADLASLGDVATSLHPAFYDDYRSREVFTEETCNSCHADLALHGERTEGAYCVTCHNPGSADANSGNSVDLKVLIHRIHNGPNLPSVAGGTPYKIWGFRNGEHDYSHVSYPQDVRNCTRCHAGQEDVEWAAMEGLSAPRAVLTPDGHNWASKPSAAACVACHEDAAGHTSEMLTCDVCHGANAPPKTSTREAHRNLIAEAATRFQPRIHAISNTGPGEFPEILFSIVDPGNGDAPYDLQADPAWTQGGGASRLAIDLAWSTSDYTNTGNGGESASAVSIDGLSATPVGGGRYRAVSPVAIPDGSQAPGVAATGSGAIGIEGHPALDFGDGDEAQIERIPMDNVIDFFSIDEDDGTPDPRREVVSIAKCQDCHQSLSLHGNNRNNNDQVCALCHNPRNTDREVRAIAANPPTDGKDEESLHLKTMIHAIHAAGVRENPLQVVGFNGFTTYVYDEEHVQYPGDLSNCESCHTVDSYGLPLPAGALATTVDTGANHEDPADDLADTPMAAACASCHDSESAKSHMVSTGGALFAAPLAEAESAVESCDVCHGNGASAGVDVVHPGLR
jgi:OmcA/MtrC family decaheme c-type cytochrome